MIREAKKQMNIAASVKDVNSEAIQEATKDAIKHSRTVTPLGVHYVPVRAGKVYSRLNWANKGAKVDRGSTQKMGMDTLSWKRYVAGLRMQIARRDGIVK